MAVRAYLYASTPLVYEMVFGQNQSSDKINNKTSSILGMVALVPTNEQCLIFNFSEPLKQAIGNPALHIRNDDVNIVGWKTHTVRMISTLTTSLLNQTSLQPLVPVYLCERT
jgi:hypothetical protein